MVREPSEEDIAFAADLAAFFSKARSEGKVDVTMADVADLRKPTGANPGQVNPEALLIYGRHGMLDGIGCCRVGPPVTTPP